jgi:hypothetical protein
VFFKKKKRLTSHQRAIAIAHLSIRIHQLEDNLADKKRKGEDTWAIQHDIDCLKSTIEFLD